MAMIYERSGRDPEFVAYVPGGAFIMGSRALVHAIEPAGDVIWRMAEEAETLIQKLADAK